MSRAARIAQDRAVAERARAPLHAALKPAEDPALGDRNAAAPAELLLVTDLLDSQPDRAISSRRRQSRVIIRRRNRGPQKA